MTSDNLIVNYRANSSSPASTADSERPHEPVPPVPPDHVRLFLWQDQAAFLFLVLPIWLLRKYTRPFRGLRFIAYSVLGVDGCVRDKGGLQTDGEATWDAADVESGAEFYFDPVGE